MCGGGTGSQQSGGNGAMLKTNPNPSGPTFQNLSSVPGFTPSNYFDPYRQPGNPPPQPPIHPPIDTSIFQHSNNQIRPPTDVFNAPPPPTFNQPTFRPPTDFSRPAPPPPRPPSDQFRPPGDVSRPFTPPTFQGPQFRPPEFQSKPFTANQPQAGNTNNPFRPLTPIGQGMGKNVDQYGIPRFNIPSAFDPVTGQNVQSVGGIPLEQLMPRGGRGFGFNPQTRMNEINGNPFSGYTDKGSVGFGNWDQRFSDIVRRLQFGG